MSVKQSRHTGSAQLEAALEQLKPIHEEVLATEKLRADTTEAMLAVVIEKDQ